MMTGARTPVPLHLGGNDFKIFFGAYDEKGRGRIFNLTMEVSESPVVHALDTHPIVDLGEFGHFDDNGVIPSDLVVSGDEIYLYTIGFSQKNKVMFDAASGLALSTDGGASFRKFRGPVLDRDEDSPCWAASPSVLKNGDQWRMWFVGSDSWDAALEDRGHHRYQIRTRDSTDGKDWSARSKLAIGPIDSSEYAIARPSVIGNDDDGYKMWFTTRSEGGAYSIQFADSTDGREWARHEDGNSLYGSGSGWDSDMVCYPSVFSHDESLYMLFNGNGFGRSGFGLAVWLD